jgi:hypothetical protein
MIIFSLFSHGCHEVFAVTSHELSAIYTKKFSIDPEALFHVWTIKVTTPKCDTVSVWLFGRGWYKKFIGRAISKCKRN